MTVDLAQLAWIMYVLILGAVFFFVVYLVRLLGNILPVLKNLNITLQKTNVMLDDVQAIVGDAKEMTSDVTMKYQQLSELLASVMEQVGSIFGGKFGKKTTAQTTPDENPIKATADSVVAEMQTEGSSENEPGRN